MKALGAKATRAINIGAYVKVADNSGALIAKVVSVKKGKVGKGRQQYAKMADLVKVAVKKGTPEMKGNVFDAVIVRLKRPYRRKTGERIAFMDNAVVILKDDKGNPKGTQVKGPVAREVNERWQPVAKIAKFVL
jgi:large subunit ribosomal protein L14